MSEEQELRAPGASCWTTEYWLEHCEGFQAWSGGELVGYVDTVLVDDRGRPHSLMVHIGEAFSHLVAIPAEAVIRVEPASERIEFAAKATVKGAQLSIPIVV